MEGALEGVREVATPVFFAVLTTVAAFSPLLFVPGLLGKMMRYVPLIVIPCLLFSLVESLNILPAHLAHRRAGAARCGGSRFQRTLADGIETFVDRAYRPALAARPCAGAISRWPRGVSVLVPDGRVSSLGGRVAFQFFPAPEADVVYATLTMPLGTPAAVTSAAAQRLEDSAERVAARSAGADRFPTRCGTS